MRHPTPNFDISESRTRRHFMQVIAGGSCAILLLKTGLIATVSAVQEDKQDNHGHESDTESGRGRGRGRGGRGGRDENDHDRDDGDEIVEQIETGEVPAGALEIRIDSDDAGGFVPAELTVDQGQSVAFVNAHDDEHTATGSGFDTGIIQPGSVVTVTLDTPGRFAYACQIHPEMTGAIAVRDSAGNIPEAATTTAPAGATKVTITDLTFEPAQLDVSSGTTVVWENRDSVPHTVTSADGAFDSGIFDPGATFSWTFDRSGTFAYACQLHPAMRGSVVVAGQPSSTSAETSAAPTETEPQTASPFIGAWSVDLIPDDTTLFAEQKMLLTFRDDGTLEAEFASISASSDVTPHLGGGHGEWMQRDDLLAFAMAALLSDEVGHFAAVVTIEGEVTVEAAGSGIDGTFRFSAAATNGDPLGDGSGNVWGHKLL